MDISNSTDQNTGYKVLGSGGATPRDPKSGPGKGKDKDLKSAPKPLHEGTLEPNTYVTLPVPPASACKVEFHRAGKKIGEQMIGEGKCEEVLVALVPNGKGAPKAFACRKKV